MTATPDAHGAADAPHRDQPGERAALLVIDMVNPLDFPEAAALKPAAIAAAETIAGLRQQFEARGWPVIFVNDNFGEWHSERDRLIDHARDGGGELLARIAPGRDDFFVLKPQFSGFYATNLPVLLPKLGVTRLVLSGIATDICVLFTAADAHMRDYALWVPSDAVAAETAERGTWALEIMANAMGARTDPAQAFGLDEWLATLKA
jgi:nicotinamidase-related amidase